MYLLCSKGGNSLKVIDNISTLLRDELIESIKKGSKMTIAASCFSMYAYKELKKQLDNIEELRFIFTSPTFVKESAKKRSVSSLFPVWTESRDYTVRNLR